MHFPISSKERSNIFIGKEIRRTMRAVNHLNIPMLLKLWLYIRRQRHNSGQIRRQWRYVQYIPATQDPPGMTTKLT